MAACGRPVRLYACGGDGTLNEILQGAAGHPQVELACLPLGSGNDFVRNFACPIERFRDVKAQIRGEAQSLDVILTDRGYCAAICSAGLDAQVAYGIPKFRRIPLCGGTMAYKLSILQQLLGPLGRRLVLEIDGQRMEQDCLMAAVCNGSTYGGGFYAAPQASLTDGLLDVVVVRRIGLLRIARVLGLYKEGRHMRNGEVLPELQDVIWTTRARHVTVHPGRRRQHCGEPGRGVRPASRPGSPGGARRGAVCSACRRITRAVIAYPDTAAPGRPLWRVGSPGPLLRTVHKKFLFYPLDFCIKTA